MPSILLLVVALQGGNWHCLQTDRGLWECRSPARALRQESPEAVTPGRETGFGEATESSAPLTPSTDRRGASPMPSSAEPRAARPGPGAPAALHESAAADSAGRRSIEGEKDAIQAEEGAYLVQIGAYRSRERASRAAASLDEPDLQVVPTRRDGEAWYVLVLGAYPTRAAADGAGRAFVEAHPGGSYWVRSAASLRKVKTP